jgi:glycosyltransferase involved in cell wall biosynthesis
LEKDGCQQSEACIVKMHSLESEGSQRRVRVVCIIDSVAHHAGTENQLVELLRRIDSSRFEMHLCCLEDSERLQKLAVHHKTVIFPAPSVFSRNGLLQILALRKYLNQNGIDILHTFMVRANILGVFAANWSRCRVVIASRRNLGYWFTPFYKSLFRFLNARTTRLLANSDSARLVAIGLEGVRPAKVDVLYNGVDIDRYGANQATEESPVKLGIPPEAKVVGVLANLRPVKDLPLFLQAAKIVSMVHPDAVFLIIGRGPLLDELKRLAEELGIADKVFFTNGEGKVVDYLHRMSIGCLSSSSEGFSNAILEYMAAGLPVVATDVGGNREAIEEGVTGFVVPDREPSSFAAPLIELLANEPKRQKMGKASYERCHRLYHIDHATRLQEKYYLELLGARSDANLEVSR